MTHPQPFPLRSVESTTSLAKLVVIMVSRMTRVELGERLQKYHGEVAPTKWTRAQLLHRLSELEGEVILEPKSKELSPLRTLEVAINKASARKANLQEYLTVNMGMTLTGTETIAQLKVKGLNQAYVMAAPHPTDFVGFGKHCDKKYEEIWMEQPSYARWVMQTSKEDPESSMKLHRLAKWLEEMTELEQVTEATAEHSKNPKKGYPVKKKDAEKSNSSSEMMEMALALKALTKEVADMKEDRETRRKQPSAATSSDWEKTSQMPVDQ